MMPRSILKSSRASTETLPPYSQRTEHHVLSKGPELNEKKALRVTDLDQPRHEKKYTKGRKISGRWVAKLELSHPPPGLKRYEGVYEVMAPSGHHRVKRMWIPSISKAWLQINYDECGDSRGSLLKRVARFVHDLISSSRSQLYFLRLVPGSVDDESKKYMPELMVLHKCWLYGHKSASDAKTRTPGAVCSEFSELSKYPVGEMLNKFFAAKIETFGIFADIRALAMQAHAAESSTARLMKRAERPQATALDKDQYQHCQDREAVILDMLRERLDTTSESLYQLADACMDLTRGIHETARELRRHKCGLSHNKIVKKFDKFIEVWWKSETAKADESESTPTDMEFWKHYVSPMIKTEPVDGEARYDAFGQVTEDDLWDLLETEKPAKLESGDPEETTPTLLSKASLTTIESMVPVV